MAPARRRGRDPRAAGAGLIAPAGRAERIAALAYDYAGREKRPVSACDLCGRDAWTVLAHRDRYGLPATATGCRECGLVVLSPRMTPDGYRHFYEEVYRPLVSAYHGRRVDAESIRAEQRDYALELEPFVAPYLEGRRGGTLLDVGGSTGVMADAFARRFGLRPTVVDPAPDELALAGEAGIETVPSLVEEWDPGGRRFDVVGMFQTADHLLDVAGTLAKLREVLADDGVLVVDIVDFRASYLRQWSVEAAVKVDHPYYLTEPTMEAFLARAGFSPLRKVYSSGHLLVGYVCAPCDPDPERLPTRDSVERLFWEIRTVQNAPRPVA